MVFFGAHKQARKNQGLVLKYIALKYMKHAKYFIIIALFLLFGLFVIFRFSKNTSPTVPSTQQFIQVKPKVTVLVDDSINVATYSGVTASTAYEALVNTAADELFTLKTKQYDFGVFVEQIGELPNTNDKAWIYYLNNKSATQAADKQEVREGDVVRWKYEKPMY